LYPVHGVLSSVFYFVLLTIKTQLERKTYVDVGILGWINGRIGRNFLICCVEGWMCCSGECLELSKSGEGRYNYARFDV
jgi:hypothetical protein